MHAPITMTSNESATGATRKPRRLKPGILGARALSRRDANMPNRCDDKSTPWRRAAALASGKGEEGSAPFPWKCFFSRIATYQLSEILVLTATTGTKDDNRTTRNKQEAASRQRDGAGTASGGQRTSFRVELFTSIVEIDFSDAVS